MTNENGGCSSGRLEVSFGRRFVSIGSLIHVLHYERWSQSRALLTPNPIACIEALEENYKPIKSRNL